MARAARQRPKRLGLKLRRVREALDLTQGELIELLRRSGVKGLAQGSISAYESNGREPSLIFLLALARAAGVSVDVLIDDALDLPARLPAAVKIKGTGRNLRTVKAVRRSRERGGKTS